MSAPVRHAFTVGEWEQMGAAGMFAGTRVELLDGEVVEMSPVGSRHAACVDRLTRMLVRAVGDRAMVRVQNPVRLDERSEPQPDLALLRPPFEVYEGRHPGPADVLLLIEVADTSLAFDRGVKLPLYARAGVGEVWVVDLEGRQVLRHLRGGPGGYGDVTGFAAGSVLEPAALPGVAVPVADVLGAH